MRALRGDLFEIADEDPLALFPETVDASDATRAIKAPSRAEQSSSPSDAQAVHGNRLGASVRRLTACAAVVCSAAGLIVVVGTPDSQQRKLAPQLPAARAPEADLQAGRGEPTGKSRRPNTAIRQRRTPTYAIAIPASTPGRTSAPPVTPVTPVATPIHSARDPDITEREFGFER